jgi:hypothetical protein
MKSMSGMKIVLIPLVAAMGLWLQKSSLSGSLLQKEAVPGASPAVNAGSPRAGGFALVELFTSEGCSSCPPADALLSEIRKENHGPVYVLGFHVDYWNRLGWKDPFSNADYSRRQTKYAQAFRLESVYTPQMVVNGKTEFVGSDATRLRSAITNELKNAIGREARVEAVPSNGNTIHVSYELDNPGGVSLQIALVQLQAGSRVLAGENSGRSLDHVNVVRDFNTVSGARGGSGAVDLKIPAGLTEKDCKVIWFLQNDADMHVLGVGGVD